MLSTEQLFLFLEGKFGSFKFPKEKIKHSLPLKKYSSVSLVLAAAVIPWTGILLVESLYFQDSLIFWKFWKQKRQGIWPLKLSPLSDCIEGIPLKRQSGNHLEYNVGVMKETECSLFLRMHLPTYQLNCSNDPWTSQGRERTTNEILRVDLNPPFASFLSSCSPFLYVPQDLCICCSLLHTIMLYSFFPLFLSLCLYLESYQSLKYLNQQKGYLLFSKSLCVQ